MTKTTRYTYRDFEDKTKTHWTAAPFTGWNGPGGPLNVYYATFQRPSGLLLVPEYLLPAETLAQLPPAPEGSRARERQDRLHDEVPAPQTQSATKPK